MKISASSSCLGLLSFSLQCLFFLSTFSRTMKSRGFTLVELLVVISIISFLSSVVLANLNTARAKARDAQRISDMHQLQNALELYKNTYGSYPNCINQVSNGICGDAGGNLNTGYTSFSTALSPLIPNNIPSIPKDPLNTNNLGYEYMTKNIPLPPNANSTTTPPASWLTCDSDQAKKYEYVLTFRTEKTYFNLPKFGVNGSPFNQPPYGPRGNALNEYCILGPQ